jgi:hypothetical protein
MIFSGTGTYNGRKQPCPLISRMEAAMKIYDVYRGEELKACIRIWDTGEIEWAYRPQQAEWSGFWWSNEVKSAIEHMIREYPHLDEFPIADFVIRLRGTEVISL